MGERKSIKISFATTICIIIIILLVITLGIVYYLRFIENKEEISKINEEKQVLEVQKEELERQIQLLKSDEEDKLNDETSKNINILSSSEIQNVLGKEDAIFCIENIEKDEQGYIITAYLLEKEAREISKAEYEDLIEGKEIKFRNLMWKFDNYLSDSKDISIKSENNKLAIMYDEEKGIIENIAGAKSGGLCDYSNQLISFKVDENLLIGTLFVEFNYDNDGILKMYDMEGKEIKENKPTIMDLLKWSEENTDTYEECKAYIKNGKVEAIQIFHD